MPDPTVHKIREQLQEILTGGETSRDALAKRVEIISKLLLVLENKVTCPMEDKCPVMHPVTSKKAKC